MDHLAKSSVNANKEAGNPKQNITNPENNFKNEEQTKDLIKKIGDNFRNLIDSINLGDDTNSAENKLNRINLEMKNFENKIGLGKIN